MDETIYVILNVPFDFALEVWFSLLWEIQCKKLDFYILLAFYSANLFGIR